MQQYAEIFAIMFVIGVPMGALMRASRLISIVYCVGAFCFGLGAGGASVLIAPWWFWLLSFLGMFGGMWVGGHAEAIEDSLLRRWWGGKNQKTKEQQTPLELTPY